jgi:hypothetical protein
LDLSSYLQDENLTDKLQTSYFNMIPPSLYKGKLTDEEIRIVSEYVIKNLYLKVPNENLYSILQDVIKIFSRINKYLKFSKFLLANIIFIMKKLYKKCDSFGGKYFEYNNVAFSIVICYLIIQKFYFDENYYINDFCNLFNANQKIISKEEIHILETINYDFNITGNEIQLVLSEIF